MGRGKNATPKKEGKKNYIYIYKKYPLRGFSDSLADKCGSRVLQSWKAINCVIYLVTCAISHGLESARVFSPQTFTLCLCVCVRVRVTLFHFSRELNHIKKKFSEIWKDNATPRERAGFIEGVRRVAEGGRVRW